jgi:hypothetical protein
MAPYLGVRHAAEDLQAHREDDGGELADVLPMVRAYDVPALQGERLRVRALEEIGPGMEKLLVSACPDIEWRVDEGRWSLPLQKYEILHASVAAPPDRSSGQPMALEVFGRAARLGAVDLGARGAPGLAALLGLDPRREYPPDCDRFAEALVASGNDLEIVISKGTYANILFPGVGVPYYE